MAASPPASCRWLFGPAPDLLLGCGGVWMAAFALQGALGADVLSARLPGGLLVMAFAISYYGGLCSSD
jgi:hypothetical protein